MKLFIITYTHPDDIAGGSEIECGIISKYLAEKGHRIYYISMHNPLGKPQRQDTNGYTLIRCSGPNDFPAALKEFRPEICYIRTISHLRYLCTHVKRFPAIKTVFHISSHFEASWFLGLPYFTLNPKHLFGFILKNIAHTLNFLSMRKIDLLCSVSNEIAAKVGKFGLKTTVLPDVCEEAYLPKDAHTKPRVIWVGNLKPIKRPELFIELAKTNRAQVDFLMIGQIQHRRYHRLIEKATKTTPNFHYLGTRPYAQAHALINDSSVLVNTSRSEGWGCVFLQAWMCGVPTVTLGVDPDGVMEKNQIGFFCSSMQECATRIDRLLQDDSLRHDMGSRAQAYFKTHHTPDKLINTLEPLLMGLLDSDARHNERA